LNEKRQSKFSDQIKAKGGSQMLNTIKEGNESMVNEEAKQELNLVD